MDSRIERIVLAADGRWAELFASAGMDPLHFERQNRPCPLCGGRDRFSLLPRGERGDWFCRGCGHGDGIELLRRFTGRSFPQTLRWLEDRLGLPHEERKPSGELLERGDPLDAGREEAERIERLTREWSAATPLSELSADAPVLRYLARRGLAGCGLSRMLRMEPGSPCWGEDAAGGVKLLGTFPAMLALVTDPDGRITSLHRTFLTAEGDKAPVPAVKKLAAGSVGEGLVRLFPASDLLCLAEGIETALSVHAMTGLPAWSAISVTGFKRLERLPAGLRRLFICGDNDASYAGAAGAYELAARLRRTHPELEVSVRIPEEAGSDWNDVLRSGGALHF